MNLLRSCLLLLALLTGGCTHVYTHTFKAEPVETLSPQEVRDVLTKFKVYLASRGMRQVIEPGMNADYATFDISSGNIALPRVPFQEYLRLSYSAERGFTLTITRAVTHPANFTNQYLTDFRLAVEQIIADVTSKDVRGSPEKEPRIRLLTYYNRPIFGNSPTSGAT